jgi:hypothetical protein
MRTSAIFPATTTTTTQTQRRVRFCIEEKRRFPDDKGIGACADLNPETGVAKVAIIQKRI